MSARTRVGVIGLGTSGSMAMWQLSKDKDVEVIGFEQFGVGHGYGAFTGESRLFRTAYHEGAKYVPLLLRARELWQDLGGLTGRRLLNPFGVLSVGKEDHAPFKRMVESVEQFGLPHERLTAEAMRHRYPGLDFRDDEAGVLDLYGGALRPELAVLSALEQAKLNGATVFDHERILNVEDLADEGVKITTESREVMVDRVIVTAGSWVKELVPEVCDLIEIRKLALTWFLPKSYSDFVPEQLPCFIRDRDGFHVFGAPSVDGYSVKIAGMDIWGAPGKERIENADLRLDPEAVSAFGEKVVDMFPGVQPEPNRYSVHFDSFTSSKDPIIDRIGNVVVVTGLSGHGFKMATALGELAGDLAVHGEAEFMHPDFTIAAHEPIHAKV
ncbi:N-methyl-L-tryptophan oxidase [Corynebacterium alimapuense]|uniref:N-methyl-L-tryptophan oxidase n=1 Tax=Corynebacterium alimapuense TaxID=1576874 RepID=A0A3M8K6R8_9CORY|nr:N-methyl-L-tryptophan oxidase [Corynebacterium alimapuense]RNE48204.1 N-methyl-L-tryptophan oxidase [Corynebacterium alimapuense]